MSYCESCQSMENVKEYVISLRGARKRISLCDDCEHIFRDMMQCCAMCRHYHGACKREGQHLEIADPEVMRCGKWEGRS